MLDRERVREVYAEVVGAPENERAAVLDRLCAADAALRAEVQSLLDAQARRPGLMASPGIGSGEAPGSRIGPYRVLEEIGHGGFGTVYMAEQDRPVHRRVALKVINLGMDTRAVIARFEAERQALALMDHGNIARVFEAGATEAGRPYFAMELVRGEPITTYCDRNNLSIAERLGVFMQVCQAVQHAHSKGVIHRDLKPSNVLVATEDGKPLAKVIDFGVAKATGHRSTEKTALTELRQFIGTPEYMSPEQADGSQNIDTRTDVYSLGVLLYQLLTGATPFDGASLRSAAYGEIQRIIREVEPPKPSTRVSALGGAMATVASQRQTAPGRLSPLLRGDLDWIVMRCLEKDRARRYATADALAAELGAYLRGEPVSAAPPSAAYRVRKFAARNRSLVVGIGAVFAALLLGVAGTTWGLVDARRTEGTAQRERDSANAARDFLSRTFGGVSPQVARGRNTELLGALMDNAVARIESGELAGNADAESELRVVVGEVYLEIVRYREARRVVEPLGDGAGLRPDLRVRLLLLRSDFAIQDGNVGVSEALLAEAQRVLDSRPDPTLRLGLLTSRSQAAVERNLISEAIAIQRQAVAAARALPRPDPEALAQQLLILGRVLKRQNMEAEALAAWQEALDELSRASGPASGALDSPVKVDILVARAAAFAQGRNADAALADLAEARRLAEGMFPKDHPTIQAIHYALSNVHLHTGRSAEALAEFETLLTIRRSLFGPESLQVASTLDSIAEIHYRAGRWQQSLDTASEGERIRGLHHTPEAQAALGGWTTVADSLCRLGRGEEGLALAQRSVALQRATLEPESEEGAVGLATLVKCLYATGRYQETAEQGRAFIAMCRERRPDRPPATYYDMHVLTASALLDWGDARGMPECEALLRTSVEKRLQLYGEADPRVALARVQLGRAIAAQVLSDAAAAAAAPTGGPVLVRAREAESLISLNYQTVVNNIGRLDQAVRVRRVRDAAVSLVALYEQWERFEPGVSRQALSQQWRERSDADIRAIGAGANPPMQK